MTKFVKSIALAAVLAGASTGASAANLVTNGDFETGNLSGWTVHNYAGTTPGTGIQVVTTNGSPNVPYSGDTINAYQGTGENAAFFVDDNAFQTLSQYVSLVKDTTYTLSFGLFATLSGENNPFNFTLSEIVNSGFNVEVLDFQTSIGNSLVPGNWKTYNYTFTANKNANYNLLFSFNSGATPAKDVLLDGVSITAVPEPSTWAMMIGGLGLVGVALRRRKTTVSFA